MIRLGKIGARLLSPLPYDAKVEYLDSTGTQWIDTLVNADSNLSVEITMANVGTPWTNVNPTGTIRSSPRCRHHLNFGAYDVVYYFGVGDSCNLRSHVKPSDGEIFTFKVDAISKTFTLGSLLGNFPNDTFDTGLSYWLFGRNSTTPPYLGSLRTYSAKLWDGSTLVRDFIPVRFTNENGVSEGAMYDRRGIGGMNPDGSARNDGLYRNRGTGVFVIGPDKN